MKPRVFAVHASAGVARKGAARGRYGVPDAKEEDEHEGSKNKASMVGV